ncbi:MAG: DUF4111 domain-containing protein [Clostridia bacterium]|nr:DUF4111 domain-containing protein [Clostridia bacterium]
MEQRILPFLQRMNDLLDGHLLSVHLYGSCVMSDFQPGWSDIDLLCFTDGSIPAAQAEKLMTLRQTMVDETGDPLFRSIEGALVCADEFEKDQFTSVIYWGTGGQRIKTHYMLDAFSCHSVTHFGRCIYGNDLSSIVPKVSFHDLLYEIRQHLTTIRIHAQQTNESLYSCGWLLDIARCLYTLRHKTIISKTEAGKWALEQHLCPEPIQMKRTLAVRQNPSEALKTPEIRAWLKALGPSIQKFAHVLENELKEHEND